MRVFVHTSGTAEAVANPGCRWTGGRATLGPAGWHFGELSPNSTPPERRRPQPACPGCHCPGGSLVDAHEEMRDRTRRALADGGYEDVLEDSTTQLTAILEHIGLSYTEAFGSGHRALFADPSRKAPTCAICSPSRSPTWSRSPARNWRYAYDLT